MWKKEIVAKRYHRYSITDRVCPEGSAKCADNIKCITQVQFCNGGADCADGSDEDPLVCNASKYLVELLPNIT